MFNYQRIVNEKNKYEKEATQRMILIYQVIIVFSIIFILSFIFFKKEQNRKKRFAHLKEEQYKRSQQYIEDNEKQISQLKEMEWEISELTRFINSNEKIKCKKKEMK